MPSDNHRPDPDALLAASPPKRGRLKLFFGAAPGVGKTYAMLAEAREQYAAGLAVLVGWVDTHGRAETETLLSGLDCLPRRQLEYRGKVLSEFDIDATLARHPALVLVDELAHTNVSGSRHPKRWQDVEELLAAGINVYSTLNVQHLESLNEVVSRVTGVRVGETVPDRVFDMADEVRLVDLPPDDLLARLKAGKVYLPEVAGRAAENFFRKGNLIALRELALRRTADRVDDQMRAHRQQQALTPVWPTRFGFLLLVDAHGGDSAVRSTGRLADTLGAQWHAVWIDRGNAPLHEREKVLAALALAEQQGASTLVIGEHNRAAALAAYARRYNLSIVVLPRMGRHWWPWCGEDLLGELGQRAPELDCLVLAETPGSPRDEHPRKREAIDLRPRRYLLAAAACVGVTLAVSPLARVLEPTNLIMFYLLAVLGVALRLGRGPAALAAVLSVASFDFFFVSPRFSFAVSDVQYVVTFFVMLVVGLVAGQLVARQRHEASRAREREARTRYLYEMARELSTALLTEQVTDTAARFLKASLNAHIALWLPDEQEKQLVPHSDQASGDHGDAAIAKWCYDHQQIAGFGSNTLPLAPALYLPLKAPMRTRGALAVMLAETTPLRDPDNRRLCEAVAALIAQTLERLHYIEVAQHTLLSMESERLRHSLLAALSHDLRTPLTALSGTAELLARKLGHQSDEAGLAWSIVDQSQRTTRLVTNLLEMARLQAGGVVLKEDWVSAEELVGSALTALETLLADRKISLAIPTDYPLLFGDAVLLERVLVNLLENATKYSPAGSEIGIEAGVNNSALELTVWDHGPGLPPGDPERLFAPFSRGERESAIAGVGLGLAICRTIAEVHHGKLTAANGLNGGARFTLSLPLKPQPELDPLAEEPLS
ncbi:DUF4118 domain-containing protein [Crenobacter sp. SG2305]|uniref:DUF4118 domain-containing protein n=1 Tax=Crenobacter oryzisoli TaxID=3056844 RepID=UPI0025AB471D|nr:DUF4118 domain-containing protein [Crenobacter sp. SG2305]MDN0084700.1 DUF4118 domain-containing protein [Crenobacter sp. SG2305]